MEQLEGDRPDGVLSPPNVGITVQEVDLEVKLSDSGVGSSLLSMPLKPVDQQGQLDVSHESEEEKTEVPPVNEGTPELNIAFYVARSLAERMVLDNPPAPQLGKLSPFPVASATTGRYQGS